MANTRRINGVLLVMLMVLPHLSCAAADDKAGGCLEVILTGTQGAHIFVHSVIHPVFAPGGESAFPEHVYLRQSSAADLGAMAERAGISHLVMTHMIPALNAPSHGPFTVPGGPITEEGFHSEAIKGGVGGQIHVGSDLLRLRIPSKYVRKFTNDKINDIFLIAFILTIIYIHKLKIS